eukprot:5807690-Pyramimonas_sp.AAC.2
MTTSQMYGPTSSTVVNTRKGGLNSAVDRKFITANSPSGAVCGRTAGTGQAKVGKSGAAGRRRKLPLRQ